jgi:hypothetical protein
MIHYGIRETRRNLVTKSPTFKPSLVEDVDEDEQLDANVSSTVTRFTLNELSIPLKLILFFVVVRLNVMHPT